MMKHKLITLFVFSLILSLLNACETGVYIRGYNAYNDTQYRVINWGYTTADPLLNAGYYGNFYSSASPYDYHPTIIQESEGAIGQ